MFSGVVFFHWIDEKCLFLGLRIGYRASLSHTATTKDICIPLYLFYVNYYEMKYCSALNIQDLPNKEITSSHVESSQIKKLLCPKETKNTLLKLLYSCIHYTHPTRNSQKFVKAR